MRTLLLCLAFVLLPLRATADEEPGPWALGARTAYAYLGPRQRPTGGMLVAADLTREWPLGESSFATVGAELSAFGFDAGGRWTAVLGGPTASIRTRTMLRPIYLGLAVHLDAGRLPTCNPWGLCLLYSGLFPAGYLAVRYEPSERVAFDLNGGARVVRTLGWSGAGAEGGLAGTVKF